MVQTRIRPVWNDGVAIRSHEEVAWVTLRPRPTGRSLLPALLQWAAVGGACGGLRVLWEGLGPEGPPTGMASYGKAMRRRALTAAGFRDTLRASAGGAAHSGCGA